MRAAYVDQGIDLPESFRLARRWASQEGGVITVVGPDTRAIEHSSYLVSSGLPIGIVSNRRSRFAAKPRSGTVIAWCLRFDEILDLEKYADLDGIVVVRALKSHAPWITAHKAERLGAGKPGAGKSRRVAEASPAIKAMVEGITMQAVLNHGLADPRERSTAVQALTYMHKRGHELVPEQLVVEAIKNGWPGDSPKELADLAVKINAGKRLRFDDRLNPAAMAEWNSAE